MMEFEKPEETVRKQRLEIQRRKIRALQAHYLALVVEASALILEAGFDNEGDQESVASAAAELLDPDSVHQGSIESVAAHYGLTT